MTTTTTNVAAENEVTAAQKTNQTKNGKTTEKTQSQKVIEPQKSPSIDEQLAYFEGLEKLVKKRRSFDSHIAAINRLKFTKEDFTIFDTQEQTNCRITLLDNERNSYTIENPKLVAAVKSYLVTLLNENVKVIDNDITTYGLTA